MPGAVLFDLDGVLIDSFEAWFSLMNDTSVAFGCRPIPREVYEASFGQGMEADSERFYNGRPVEEIRRYYLENFGRHVGRTTIHPDAARVLTTLRERGIRTAVITNTPSDMARQILAKAGITPDVLVGGGDVPNSKPAPDMVIRACEALKVDRNQAVVVGDSGFDRDAAQAAGVRFVGFGIEGDETLAELADVLRLA